MRARQPTQMFLAVTPGFGLSGAEFYPGVFAGAAADARIKSVFISLSDRPSIGFEDQARLYKIMRELAGI